MKILKYILAIILILVILFLLLGVFRPSVSYECEVSVNKSPKESWAVMNDQDKLSKWIKGYKRSELVSGTAQTVGAVSNVFVDDRGKEMMMTETIKSVEENSHLEMEFSMDFMNMDYKISFNEEDNMTIIKSNSVTTGNGMFAKSMIALMPSAMKAQEQENLENLKKLIDSNTKNYFPVEEAAIEQLIED